MKYKIKNSKFLKNILWTDFLLGSSTAFIGLIFYIKLEILLGLSQDIIFWISVITLSYAIGAFILAISNKVSVSSLRVLVYANWFWTGVSIILTFTHFNQAELLGKIFLILQIAVVGGLAFIEGKQIVLNESNPEIASN